MRNPVKRSDKTAAKKSSKKSAKAKSQPKVLSFRGPDDAKSAQSSNIAGVRYDVTNDNDGNSVLTVSGQSGFLDRFVCKDYESAKRVAQFIDDGKVLLYKW